MTRRPLAGDTPVDPDDARVVREAAATAIEREKDAEAGRIVDALRDEVINPGT